MIQIRYRFSVYFVKSLYLPAIPEFKIFYSFSVIDFHAEPVNCEISCALHLKFSSDSPDGSGSPQMQDPHF